MRVNRKPIPDPLSTIKLVPRAEWGADFQDGDIPPLPLPATNVFFTYTGTDQCSSNSNTLPSCHNVVRTLQHQALFDYGLPDIAYNFLLGGDGCVYEGRGWNLKPEPIPDEPELNERNTLVVAYIGKKEDDYPVNEANLMNTAGIAFTKEAMDKRLITMPCGFWHCFLKERPIKPF